jgi:hypothetical protein
MFGILFLLNWPLEGCVIGCMREEGKIKVMRIEGNRELPHKHKKNATRWGKSENNKELLGFVGERKKTRVNNEVSIMRCPTTWLGPLTRWGPLVGNVYSSAGTGI